MFKKFIKQDFYISFYARLIYSNKTNRHKQANKNQHITTNNKKINFVMINHGILVAFHSKIFIQFRGALS